MRRPRGDSHLSLLWLTVYSERDRTVTRDVYVEREVPVRTVRER
jgi:hypothetical protein